MVLRSPVKLPSVLYTRALVREGSFDEEKGTFEVTFSTGAKVIRRDWWSGVQWVESLEVSKRAVRLERLKDGASLLDTHAAHQGLRAILGVVEDAWIDEGERKARARIRLSSFEGDPMLARVRHDVRDGIIRHISVGYNVHAWRVTKATEKTLEQREGIDWDPHELSLVPIGADAGKGMGVNRGKDDSELERDFGWFMSSEDGTSFSRCASPEAAPQREQHNGESRNGEPTVDENKLSPATATAPEQTRAPAPAAPAAPAAPQPDQVAIARAERQRLADIKRTATAVTIPESDPFVRALEDEGIPIDEARRRLVDESARRQGAGPAQPQPAQRTGHPIEVGEERMTLMRNGAEQALMVRMQLLPEAKLDDAGREFRRRSLLDMAGDLLVARGVISERDMRRMNKQTLYRAAMHTTSDFPLLVANVANKRIEKDFAAQPRTFLPLSTVYNAGDFKPISIVQLGGMSTLEEVGEHGEFSWATVGERGESYFMRTYGKMIGLTRNLIYNDDLRAFDALLSKAVRAAANVENNIVWSLWTGNVVMGDTNALFSAAHQNVGTKVLGQAGLDILYQIMSEQVDIKPKAGEEPEYVNVLPSYLVVPPPLAGTARREVAVVNPNTTTAVNPYAGKLEVIVEPRLSKAGITNGATTYFGVANPGQWPVMEHAYLDGQTGPYFELREGWNTDGVEGKVRHDFAAAFKHWIGVYRSIGTVA